MRVRDPKDDFVGQAQKGYIHFKRQSIVKIQFIVTPNCRDAGGCFLAVVEKKTILVNS